ncbi:hypothetical protein [Zunongwangia sp. HGR-M22]|uniref:hypothetical protein n=1 Tax=Zunongwangia sp. HGR-M22 TaxID=3015168 RepID=UPI0022DE6B54|nr:hypothetical protein [Zunongwangia sp. HGR-M22]WBL26729.1 hypothetical protein PBT91_05520 [Zunongwangia sp. HGR-M22]
MIANLLPFVQHYNLLPIMNLGLEYIDSIFQILKETNLISYTLTGMKTLAVLLFLVNLLKKYQEGAAKQEGTTWGLQPTDLIRNFGVVILVFIAPQILSLLDGVLVSIETEFLETTPALVPMQLQEVEMEEEIGAFDAMTKAMTAIYEALMSPFYALQVLSFISGVFLWILDLFIYPLFLAERFFILGLLQVFFPLIISLCVFEKFRGMAYTFFRLYIAVYMLVPAFFLVNIFINTLYVAINQDFFEYLLGTVPDNVIIKRLIEAASVAFIVLLKFKLYKRATSFTMRLFTD